MNDIKVLAMRDDYHERLFIAENGEYDYEDGMIAKLAKPHTETYNIRHLNLYDLPEEDEELGEYFMDLYRDVHDAKNFNALFEKFYNMAHE